jgi:hypothetical protein
MTALPNQLRFGFDPEGSSPLDPHPAAWESVRPMGQTSKRLGTGLVLAVVVAASAIFAGAAQGAFTMSATRTIPLPVSSPGGYGPGFDGTFWTGYGGGNTGYVTHYDDEGNNLGDGFTFPYNSIYPLDVGYYGGRVYMTLGSSSGSKMLGVNIGGGHDIIVSDSDTNDRMGSNQKTLRTYSNGPAALGFGQDNKIATMNLSGAGWYPQAFMGSGINKGYVPAGNNFETCAVGPGPPSSGEPTKCGTYSSYWIAGTHEGGFNYPNDVAFGQGGLYVSEYFGDRISHVNTVSQPGGVLDYRFGQGPGSAAGQIDAPQSVVVQHGTDNVFVSEEGNRRISVFTSGGGYIASFGYGVLNGANEMQVCGVEIGKCQAGVAYQANSRSYFTQLDFGPEGELYAYMPLVGQIQVFSVSSADGPAVPAPGGGGSGAPGAGGSGAAGTGTVIKQKVRLGAAPLKVKKGKKTTLTATVNGGLSCANRMVLFQAQVARSWDNLGKVVKAGKGCKAKLAVKITNRTVFRAVLIDSTNQATLANSPNVTVKLK